MRTLLYLAGNFCNLSKLQIKLSFLLTIAMTFSHACDNEFTPQSGKSIKKGAILYMTSSHASFERGKRYGSLSLINWMSEYVSVPYRIHLNIYQSQAPTFRVCSRKNIWNGLIYSACLVLLAGHSHHHHTQCDQIKTHFV